MSACQRAGGRTVKISNDFDAAVIAKDAGGDAQKRRASRLGMGTVSGADVTLGARLLAEPLRIRPGFIRAGFHTTGQGSGEHECGGGLE